MALSGSTMYFGSFAGEPMVKLPAGTTTISGHLSHSLNTSFGFSAHSSTADSGCADRDDNDTVIGALLQGPDGAKCAKPPPGVIGDGCKGATCPLGVIGVGCKVAKPPLGVIGGA